jgi:adenosylcobyric acid synthase
LPAADLHQNGRRTPAVMIQGTGSDVGKSLLVAGFARGFTRRGLAVRPFKPQNMSNNAAVTRDGGEIGRAQALQARACRIEPVSDMNPVLLKPQSDRRAQIIVQGQMRGTASADEYTKLKSGLMGAVLESFQRLSQAADLVLVEGAGSPAEVNLRHGDIANMGFAEAADIGVILVGDIDRGGVIASLVGTHELLTPDERARVRGFIINKFRGDPALFADGLAVIEDRTSWPCLGVVPWFADSDRLPAEDSMALAQRYRPDARDGRVQIAVPRLPHIANFEDLDPLAAEPGVALALVEPGRPIPADAALIVLPGSKSTCADLAALRMQGWDIDIRAHVRRGGRVLGLCGGYQMLGRVVRDPSGAEGPPGDTAGLGLLDIETTLAPAKTLRQARGRCVASGEAVSGYEIHLGHTSGPDCARPFLALADGVDGATSEDGRVAGCYLHGLFASDPFRRAYLAGLGVAAGDYAHELTIERTLDALADHVGAAIDLNRVLAIAGFTIGAAAPATR